MADKRQRPEQDRERVSTGVIFGCFLGVLAVVLAVIFVFALLHKNGGGDAETVVAEDVDSTEPGTEGSAAAGLYDEKWQEGTVLYKGKNYRYNNNIKTYLFLGIDRAGEAEETDDAISGGQSDAMFLLVEDTRNETLKIISIHRNTMALVDVYDVNGNYAGQKKMQICLQHSYGDGMKLSCNRSVEAVSRLFYNVPISGYFSLNMEGMPALNDAVGGVEVTVLNDIDSMGVSLKEGDTVTLSGDQAYAYIRSRDLDEFDSASLRLKRQEQYINAFLGKLKSELTGGEISASRLYSAVEKYAVTNIDFVNLVSESENYSFDSSNIYTVPGETVMGESFEEYQLDEVAFYELVLDVFYEETEE